MGAKRRIRETDEKNESADEDEDDFERDADGLSLYERQRLELYVASTSIASSYSHGQITTV